MRRAEGSVRDVSVLLVRFRFMSAKTMKPTVFVLAAVAVLATSIAPVMAAESSGAAATDQHKVPVTVDNFARAASDREFDRVLELTGGINRWYHYRGLLSVDHQPIVRMNRDTLYSATVVDIGRGATLTLPDTDGRYQSVSVVTQDHYITAYDEPGTYQLSADDFGTRWVLISARTFVDPRDPDELAAVHILQDKLKVVTRSAQPFSHPVYDELSFDRVRKALTVLAEGVPDSRKMYGTEDEVTEVRWLVGAAIGWGGLPAEQAIYLSRRPNLPVGEYQINVPFEVPVDAFWSVSVYNADGYYVKNSFGVYNVNSVTAEPNADGSTTVHLGGCGDRRANCIPLSEGWTYTVRLYQPHDEIIEGSWRFPDVQRVK
jgi:hypothetical protein